MEELQQGLQHLRESWKSVYSDGNTRILIGPHLKGVSPEQLDESVDVACDWLERSRAPKGFSPTFHLAKALASTAVANAVSAIENIRAGHPAYVESFIAAINQTLSALHSLAVYSDKSDSLPGDVSAELHQGIVLLQTAQRELSEKLSKLRDADEIAEKLVTQAEKASAGLAAIENSTDEVLRLKLVAEGSVAKVDSLLEESEALNKEASEAKSHHAELTANAETILKKTREQTAVVDSLLPRATSAGLAHAFSRRGKELENTKMMWGAAFLVSVCCLAILAFRLVFTAPQSPTELWQQLLTRMPLAAPFVWLGWFSAVQYGNTIRVQEDYAFKEATSNAFAGYRDHMEHLKRVSGPDSVTALEMLSAKTIEVLAKEPLRLFGRSHRDASPSHEVIAVANAIYQAVKDRKKES